MKTLLYFVLFTCCQLLIASFSNAQVSDPKKTNPKAVKLYNEERPHKSLNYLTPVDFEKKQLNLIQQTKPMMTESFDAINKSNGGIEPLRLEQTKPQNQDVFCAINSAD